jgi:group I intron endonuclease
MNLKSIPKISCIYKIVNIKNKKYYLGSTSNLYNRIGYHLSSLRKGNHVNEYLQNSFNKYGEQNFKVEVVLKCSPSKLLKKEQEFLNKIIDRQKCFNISPIAGGGDNYTNHPRKKQIYKKLVKILKRIHKDPSKRPDFKGVKNPNYGNKWSKKLKKKVSKIVKERYKNFSEEQRQQFKEIRKKTMQKFYQTEAGDKLRAKWSKERRGKNNSFYGKKHSKKTKNLIAQKNKGSIPPNRIKLEIEGVIYDSLNHAAKELNMNMTTVFHRIKSSNPQFKNWNQYGKKKKVVERKKSVKGIPLLIKGKIYKNSKEASEELKQTQTTILFKVRSQDEKYADWQWA